MPRHPPCALHSLSHKHSTRNTTTKKLQLTHKTKNNPTNHTHHTTNDAHASPARANLTSRIATRCSRPLFTNQTHPPDKPPHRAHPVKAVSSPEPHPPPTKEDEHQLRQSRHLIPQTPNSVPTTHQPVPHPGSTPTHPPPPHKTGGSRRRVVLRTRTEPDRQRTSTIPLVNTTMRHQTVVGDRGVCSLERR